MKNDDIAVLLGLGLALFAFLKWGRLLQVSHKIDTAAMVVAPPNPGDEFTYWMPDGFGLGHWVTVVYKP